MIITENWPLGVLRPMTLTKHVKFGAYWTLHVDISVNKPFPVASSGAIIIMQYWPLDVFRPRTLINPVKFGADRTLYG